MLRHCWALVLCAIPMTLLAAPVPKEISKVPADKDRLLGAWDVFGSEKEIGNGTHTLWTFTEGTMHSNSGGTDWDVKLDPSQSPKHFDITQRGGGGTTYHGIYEFDQDKLRIALAYSGPRPTDFKTPGIALNVLVKAKDPKAK